MTPISIFYSYAPEDELLCMCLEKHLSLLRRQNVITEYHHRLIIPGADWSQVIDEHFGSASIILLLISADFLASDYCYGREMQKALERCEAGVAHVIPVLLRQVDWHRAPFAHLRCLPDNEVPVTSWANQDEAFHDIAVGIRTTLEALYTIPSSETHRPTSSRDRTHRTHLLKKVRAYWIEGLLERSLHQMALITLGLHEQPDAVTNPWHLIIQEMERSARDLPAGTSIINVYDHSGGEFLILGKPGAGKTTLLLTLARDLLVRAEQDNEYPVPVVFHLSSWKIKENSFTHWFVKKEDAFDHWLVEELQRRYQLSREIGRSLIDTDSILLLLDGLDEIDQEAQRSCIQAINTYHQKHNLVSIVLCSRSTEYFALATQMTLQTAVEIQPLTGEQVNEYLLSAEKQLEALRFMLSKDDVLRELSTNPLMLSVMSLAYRGKDKKNIVVENAKKELWGTSFPVLTAQSREIFRTYVQQMLHRRERSQHFLSQQIIYWLSWIAKKSSGDIYTSLFRYPPIFTGGLSVEAIALPIAFLVQLASLGVIALVLLNASFILLGLEVVPFGLILFGGWRYITSDGEVIKAGRAKMLVAYAIIPMIGIYVIVALFSPQRWLVILLSVPTFLGVLIIWWLLGSLIYLFIRIKLYLRGDIPWNYKKFLDYATKHALLYKIGDKYVFIHTLLRDYFASLDASRRQL